MAKFQTGNPYVDSFEQAPANPQRYMGQDALGCKCHRQTFCPFLKHEIGEDDIGVGYDLYSPEAIQRRKET